MRLCDAPIGLFLFEDTLCLMTEYSSEGCGRNAYIVSSGEMFWGGAKSKEERANLEVTPEEVRPDDLRPQGRWEWLGPYRYNNDGMIGTCSVCKERLRLFARNYCPNCGADMRGGGEG